jgi:hypothetical protein
MNIKNMSGNATEAAAADTSGGSSGTGGASSGASGGSSGITVPNYADLLNKMEYGDNSTDSSKLNAIITANPSLFELPSGAIDERALNCSISAPVNFLYLSTIRGGRKMNNEANGVGSGANGVGSGANGAGSGANGAGSEATVISGGGCGGGCGCGMKGGSVSGKYTGGCFTCKKGVKNITLIYSGIHIIIPKLYSKYHSAKAAKAAKTAKTAKKAKTV